MTARRVAFVANRLTVGGLERVVLELATRRIRNVVFLTTDVHHAEVIRHAPRPGLLFHELVAGPLSAGFGRPGSLDPALRPTRLFADSGYENFGELSVEEHGLTARVIDLGGRIRFETTLVPEP